MSLDKLSPIAFSLAFVAAGIVHFVKTDFYASKLPAFVPYRHGLVLAAGVFEIALAALAFFEPTRRPASLAIMAFLACVIPVNLVDLVRAHSSGLLAWVRVPFLALLATWAFFNSRL